MWGEVLHLSSCFGKVPRLILFGLDPGDPTHSTLRWLSQFLHFLCSPGVQLYAVDQSCLLRVKCKWSHLQMQMPTMGQTRNPDDCRQNYKSDKKTVTKKGLQIELIKAGFGWQHLEKLSLAGSPGKRQAERLLGVEPKESSVWGVRETPGEQLEPQFVGNACKGEQRGLILSNAGLERERLLGPVLEARWPWLLRHKPSLSLDQLKPGWQALLTSLRFLTRVISWFPKNWVWHCWYHFYSLTWQRTKTIHRVKPRESSAHGALVLNGKTQNHIYEPKVLRF